ncbi:MAG TPA: hypothetical protein VGR57_12290 [Ktedonobacterales bacterium]|nr:hypothetical protein [Ktedonobacterales bacterium]
MSEENTIRGKSSRRSMLRLAVPAAAGVAALAAGAATEAMRPGTARANDGFAYVQGVQNHSTNTTWLINDNGPGNDVVEILLNEANILPASGARGYISALTARADDGGTALHGGIGVLGVYGQSEIGQLGKLLAGVYGLAFPTGAIQFGYGVVAHNIGAGAPLWIVPEGTSGATAAGAMNPGAMWADAGGAVYNQRTGLGNNTSNAALYQLSSVNLLGAPVRILDTRGGTHPIGNGAPLVLQVTGAHGIPAGATALICNLTVTNTAGPGDLDLAPHGAPKPTSSNVNYSGGQTVANFAIVGLSTGGAIDIYAHVSSTDVIVDAAGYVI